MRYRLVRQQRLKTKDQFLSVIRHGHSTMIDGVIIYTRPGNCPRIGVSVSRKTGGAVQRNRLKRIIREVFRTSVHHFRYYKQFVFIIKTPIIRLDYHDFRKKFLNWVAENEAFESH